jgi:hypothetical protein
MFFYRESVDVDYSMEIQTPAASPGWTYVYEQKDPDHYEVISKIKTRPGSVTSLFVPQLNRLYVASQAIGDQDAAILVFEAGAIESVLSVWIDTLCALNQHARRRGGTLGGSEGTRTRSPLRDWADVLLPSFKRNLVRVYRFRRRESRDFAARVQELNSRSWNSAATTSWNLE